MENRDKQDLSDYERAVKYWKALNEYQYYKTQAEMAERMGLTRDKLVRFLRLAELPKEVAKAFSSIKEIKVDHARLLAPLLNNPKQKKNIIAEAEGIANEQQGRAEADQEPLEAAVVFKRLKLAAETKTVAKPNATSEEIKGANGKTLFNVKKGRAGQLDMKINMKNAASREELETAFQEMLSRYWQNV